MTTKTNLNSELILVVEDDQDILSTLKIFLESEGYTVLAAQNGTEALALLQTSVSPNLILLDMRMPIINGWEFAAEYLEKHETR